MEWIRENFSSIPFSFLKCMFGFNHKNTDIIIKTGCNAFEATEPKSSPLSFWTTQDILNYLRLTRIPYCELYGNMVESNNGLFGFSGYQRTGCMGCLYGCHLEKEPNRLQMLKISHPKVYGYLFDKLNYKTVCDYIEIKY